MTEQIITVEGIGQVLFCKKTHVKKMSIKLRPFQPVRVTFPLRVSGQRALNYLLSKQEWVLRTMAKINNIEKKASEAQELIYRVEKENIEYVNSKGTLIKIRLIGEKIRVSIPANIEINHPSVLQAAKKGILQKHRNRARLILPKRVDSLARKYEFAYKKVFIKNMRTRWGSCSYANNINLSMFLLNLPDHLIDYVILHELVHTTHKHHRKEFWEKLKEVCPGSLEYVKEIKKYQFFVLN